MFEKTDVDAWLVLNPDACMEGFEIMYGAVWYTLGANPLDNGNSNIDIYNYTV